MIAIFYPGNESCTYWHVIARFVWLFTFLMVKATALTWHK